MVADLPAPHPERRRSLLPASPVARVAVGLAVAVPLIMAAVVVLTAVLSVWMVWAVAGWWFFGQRFGYRHRRYGPGQRFGYRHRRYGPGRHHHRHSGYGGPRRAHGPADAGPGRGFWA